MNQLNEARDFLKGKKSYIVAAALILFAVSGVVSGQLSTQEATVIVLNGLGLSALRAGINNK